MPAAKAKIPKKRGRPPKRPSLPGILKEFPKDVTSAELAAVWGIGSRRVLQFAQDGLIPRSSTPGYFPLKEATHAYLQDLREKAAGRAGTGEQSLSAERAKETRLRSEVLEMDLAKKRGEVMTAAEVTEAVVQIARYTRGTVLSLASKLHHKFPTWTAFERKIADQVCIDALMDIVSDTSGNDPLEAAPVIQYGKDE